MAGKRDRYQQTPEERLRELTREANETAKELRNLLKRGEAFVTELNQVVRLITTESIEAEVKKQVIELKESQVEYLEDIQKDTLEAVNLMLYGKPEPSEGQRTTFEILGEKTATWLARMASLSQIADAIEHDLRTGKPVPGLNIDPDIYRRQRRGDH